MNLNSNFSHIMEQDINTTEESILSRVTDANSTGSDVVTNRPEVSVPPGHEWRMSGGVQTRHLVNNIVATSLALVTVLAHIPVLVVLQRCRRMPTSLKLLSINFVLCSLLFFAPVTVMSIIFLSLSEAYTQTFHEFRTMFTYSLYASSISAVGGLALERYIRIIYPLYSAQMLQTRYVIGYIVGTWMLGFLTTIAVITSQCDSRLQVCSIPQAVYIMRSRKWRILAASISAIMLDYGFLYALGTLFIPMLDKFQESRVKIAAVQSTFNGATFISSSLTGLFVSRWGAHTGVLVGSILIPTGFFLSFFAKNVFHLYATLGVLAGVGNSFVFVSCCMAVGQAFPDNQRSMALSVQMTVMGVTTIIYPYFLDWLSNMYGVSGTFLIMSGLFLHTFVTAIVFRYEINKTSLPESTTPSKDRINDVDNDRKAEHSVTDTKGNACTVKDTPTSRQKNVDNFVSGLCSWPFCLFCVASPLLVGNTTIFITVAQDIFMEKGLSESQSLSGFLIFNVCNTLSRLSPGIFSKFNLSCFVVSLLASLCSVAGLIIVLLSESYVAVIAGSGCVGAALGGFASSLVSAMFEILGPNRQAVGLGIIIAANGITVTGFGPAYGAIRDATGRYNDVLIVTACLNCVCAILITIILLINFIQKRRDQC